MTGSESIDQKLARLGPMFFDPTVDPIVTNKTPGAGKDILQASANNLYSGVAVSDLKGFNEKYGLNSRLVKQNSKLVEEIYRVDGRYGKYITEIVKHLEAAKAFAEPPTAKALDALITSIAPAKLPIARRTTSPGCRTRRRPSTPSTVSSRCISIRAASRAAGKPWSST
jgi:hypothetical protein